MDYINISISHVLYFLMTGDTWGHTRHQDLHHVGVGSLETARSLSAEPQRGASAQDAVRPTRVQLLEVAAVSQQLLAIGLKFISHLFLGICSIFEAPSCDMLRGKVSNFLRTSRFSSIDKTILFGVLGLLLMFSVPDRHGISAFLFAILTALITL